MPARFLTRAQVAQNSISAWLSATPCSGEASSDTSRSVVVATIASVVTTWRRTSSGHTRKTERWIEEHPFTDDEGDDA